MQFIETNLQHMKMTSRYLKELFRLKKIHSNEVISTKFFSKKFNVHPSTVTEHFQKMQALELVEYQKYKGIKLTEYGEKVGALLMRNHRILEVFFTSTLGLSQEVACEEADRIDLFISQKIINKLCILCEHPNTCPCGNEIYHY
ncbi:MAG: metal-dependent transcriptional regulator [Candidatus Helarchaeota archaeon]